MLSFKFSQLLRLLVIFHLFANSLGMFPMFENFFNKFRNNRNGHHFFGGGVNAAGGSQNGGVSIFNTAASTSTGHGNVTSITVPMFNSPLQRRVGIITTVISNAAPPENDEHSNSTLTSSHEQINVHQNFTNSEGDNSTILSSASSEQHVASSSNNNNQRSAIPTSISVTSSITASHPLPGIPLELGQQRSAPNTLTLPFTPNLFGMMSYVQAMKDIKRNYKDQEKERKMALFNKQDGGDLMTRILRTLIQKVVNKHQKHTEMLRLKIMKRQDKLQNFLQLPMVSQVIATDQTRAASAAGQPVNRLGNAGVLHHHPHSHHQAGAAAGSTAATSQVVVSRSGKPVHSILNSFVI